MFTGREPLPRANLAVLLRRFLDYEGVVTAVPEERTQFPDADTIREAVAGAEDAFQVLHDIGVFQGDSSGAMLPDASTKRSHLAALLHRLSAYIISYWEARQGTQTA